MFVVFVVNKLQQNQTNILEKSGDSTEADFIFEAEQAATVLVRPRSPPPLVDLPKEEPKLTGSAALNKMVGAARKVGKVCFFVVMFFFFFGFGKKLPFFFFFD